MKTGRAAVFDTYDNPSSEAAPASLASLLSIMLDEGTNRRMSLAKRAHDVWFSVNGDTERRHTTGVYLDTSPSRRGAGPVLWVYVDSHILLCDFAARKDTYFARLVNGGLEVSDIRFELSNDKHGHRAVRENEPAEALPPHSREDEEEIARQVQMLPESLRDPAKRAMKLSLQREMKDTT